MMFRIDRILNDSLLVFNIREIVPYVVHMKYGTLFTIQPLAYDLLIALAHAP